MNTGRVTHRPTPGDVFEIALPDGRFAYSRVFRDASIVVYREIREQSRQPPFGSRNYIFVVGIYRDVLTSGNWPRVGRDPFTSAEDPYQPPYCVKDPITGTYSIYHKGQMIAADEEVCRHLEPAAVWDAHHIIDRIVKLGLTS